MLMQPENADLESSLIGSLMLRDTAIFELPGSFVPSALPNLVARSVLASIQRLAKAGSALSLAVVVEDAKLTKTETEWLRGAILGGTMTSPMPVAEKLMVRFLRDKAIDVMREAAVELKAAKRPPKEILGEVSSKLAAIDGDIRDWVAFREAHQRVIGELGKAGIGTPLVTGFRSLDAKAQIRPGNLVVLAAQSGVGKSTLALNIADNVARRGKHVLFHSFEMDETELWARLTARKAGVPVDDLLAERVSPATIEKARVAHEDVQANGYPLLFNCGHYSLPAIMHITEKAHRQHGLALAVIDYLGLVEVDIGKNAPEEAKLALITRSLKQFAQRLQLPVLLVAQLNREVDKRQSDTKRTSKRDEGEDVPLPAPKLSDLRGSGRIGQDANLVLMLHNPWAQSPDTARRNHGPFELVIEKARMGRKSSVSLVADLQFAEFREGKP